MSARICIVHAGTHKTGTTSLQVFFQMNFDAFASGGVHVLQAGRYKVERSDGTMGATGGHHGLAWDLVGGGREELSKVVDELKTFGKRTALLSSEDFSLLYARPQELEALNEALRSVGYSPKIVLYLRAQAPYAESMYVERIKHEHVRPLERYLETIVEQGRYLPEGTRQDIAFEYTRLVEPFARVFGREHVVVRAYRSSPNAQAIFRDFLDVIGSIDPEFLTKHIKFSIQFPRENESPNFVTLLGYLHAALLPDVPIAPAAMDFVHLHAPEVSEELAFGRYALLQRDDYVQLLQRFAPGNREIERLYGAQIPFVTEADIPGEGDPLWDKARLERAVFDRCLAAWMGAASGNK